MIKRALLYLIGFILLLVLVILIALMVISPGKADPIVDKQGQPIPKSISEIRQVKAGGIDQHLIIRGENKYNPILLFLHGGPGTPEFPFMKSDELDLEKEFIVVHWDQRGAGKSYADDIPVESMTVDQLVEDAVEITEYLKTTFNQEKIYLMGHSWGSFLGTMIAARHPQHFYSYIGIGQVCYQYKGERLSLEWIKEQAQKTGVDAASEEINALEFPDSLADYTTWLTFLGTERSYVNKFGGGSERKQVNVFSLYQTFILNSPEYTIGDKIKVLRGINLSMKYFWDDVMQTNLFQEIDSISIPVHIPVSYTHLTLPTTPYV